jgi:CRP/FNR family cyclic AMP-dependent transcriptional regulator
MRRRRSNTQRLGAIPLFASCTKRELALVDRTFIELRAPAGTPLMRRGRPGRDVVVIVEGTVIARVGDQTTARLAAGDVAGEVAALGHRAHFADVIAETDVVLLQCTAAELIGLLHDAPNLTRSLLTRLASRLGADDVALVA